MNESGAGRPTRPLPWPHLLNLSVYWLGINAIWAGLGYVIYQARFTAQFGQTFAPTYVAALETLPLPWLCLFNQRWRQYPITPSRAGVVGSHTLSSARCSTSPSSSASPARIRSSRSSRS